MQVEIEFVLALRAARGPIQQCDPAVCAAKAPGSQELLETTNILLRSLTCTALNTAASGTASQSTPQGDL